MVRPSTPRRGLRRLGSVISILITLLGLAMIVPTFLGYQRYVITGTSMTGTIDRGSLVFEEVVPVSDLRVGDVITYQPPAGSEIQTLVTHRIIRIHGDEFRTQGDAVPQPDPWRFRLVQPEQSRVVLSVPNAGWPFIWLGDRLIRTLVITVPAGLITLLSLRQLASAVRERWRNRSRPTSAVAGT